MSKRRKKEEQNSIDRFKLISLALTAALADDEEEDFMVLGWKKKRVHSFWMQPYLAGRVDSTQRNTYAKLEADFLRLGCYSMFRRTKRMPPRIYKELLELVRPLITYKDTPFRESVKPEERLSMTIRYLSRGDSPESLAQGYLVGDSTVLPVIRDTCKAIYRVLHEKYLKAPSTKEEWLRVAKGFHDKWNMPHCIGAVDGKHCRIKKPPKSGSLYYNYKKFYSIVLFGLVDAEYNFLYVDVGAEGRSSDSTLWKYCTFKTDLEDPDNPLNVPEPSHFPGYPGDLPYYFVGDDAFEMTESLMKPYPSSKLSVAQRIFNYRISRARRTVENTFGILATRFRILRREIEMCPEYASIIVLACIVLHNYLKAEVPSSYLCRESTDCEDRDYRQHRGEWREEAAMPSGEPTTARNRRATVKDMRQNLTNWVMSKEGELPFQYDVVLQHDFFFER